MRAQAHEKVSAEDEAILAAAYIAINPAAVQRQIQALTSESIALATAKNTPTVKAVVTRALSDKATNQASRAS